jgi:hypothetical protein
MNIIYGTINHWPGKLREPYQRTKAPFKSGHTDTLKLLERELRSIAAECPVVQLALGPGQFTQDGRPYYRATPVHPGVIVSFSKPIRLVGETKPRKVPLAFPADRFTTWETNLRAVAIALEDLRRIDRYGVTQTSEQYTGFKALPGPLHHMPTMTVDEAATFVARQAAPLVDQITDHNLRVKARAAGASAILMDKGAYDMLYKLAAKMLHPDRRPGDAAAQAGWEQLAEAKRLLDAHHGKLAGASI